MTWLEIMNGLSLRDDQREQWVGVFVVKLTGGRRGRRMKDLIKYGKAYITVRIVWELIGIGLLIGTLVLLGRLFLDLQTFVNMW